MSPYTPSKRMYLLCYQLHYCLVHSLTRSYVLLSVYSNLLFAILNIFLVPSPVVCYVSLTTFCFSIYYLVRIIYFIKLFRSSKSLLFLINCVSTSLLHSQLLNLIRTTTIPFPIEPCTAFSFFQYSLFLILQHTPFERLH